MLKAIIKDNKIYQIVTEDLLTYISDYDEVIDFPYAMSESIYLNNFYIDENRTIQRIKSIEDLKKEEEIFRLKFFRNQKLTETDWTQVIDNQLTPECKEAFRIYRQALRDIDFNNVVWPEKPNEERI